MADKSREAFINYVCNTIKFEFASKATIAEQLYNAGFSLPELCGAGVAELNECIAPLVMDGQPHTVDVPGDIPAKLAEPTELQTLELLRDIAYAANDLGVEEAIELADYLLNQQGYRKHV